MKYKILLLFVAFLNIQAWATKTTFYPANHQAIEYVGRGDFSNPLQPKFWASGAYARINFSGSSFTAHINDEMLWGNILNYLEVKIDNQPAFRIRLSGKENKLLLAKNLPKGKHTILICKNSESENGYISFTGFDCEKLLPPPAPQKRKMEFIGDSITCGAGSDESEIKCETKGSSWHDQHNAYFAYGPSTARNLNAQWHLTSVSGIGLMHSCCGKKIIMPPVYDKINPARDTLAWNFSKYQPDVVTICLGQNDGIQDSAQFNGAYIKFIKQLRGYYPKAKLVMLSSPMASPQLKAALVKYISAIKTALNQSGENNIASYFFKINANGGCGKHPSLAEHQQIANELSTFLKKEMDW